MTIPLLNRLCLALVLASFVITGLWIVKIRPQRQLATCIGETAALYSAAVRYFNDYGEFPRGGLRDLPAALMGNNLEELDYLESLPASQKNLETGEVSDCYGNPYRFKVVDGGIRVFSSGPNGVPGDEDEIHEHSYRWAAAGQSPHGPVRELLPGQIAPPPVGRLRSE